MKKTHASLTTWLALTSLNVAPLLAQNPEPAPLPEPIPAEPAQDLPDVPPPPTGEETLDELMKNSPDVPAPNGGGLGADATYEGKTISSVVVRYNGAKTITEARILGYISSRPGQVYRLERLDEDLKKLYASGLVQDAIFFAEPEGDRVKLIVEVSSGSLLAGIGFEGALVKNQKDLRKETELNIGQVLSDQAILDAIKKLEKRYTELGYPDVTITHRLTPTARRGYSDIIFDISAGERNIIRKIRFEGNQNIPAVELRREMKTKQRGLFYFLTKSGRIDNFQLEEDFELIRKYYRSKGYLKAQVISHGRAQIKGDKIDLIIRVQEGEKYVVNQVNFGQLQYFTADELRPGLSLLDGDPYSGDKLADDVQNIRSYYGSRGFADAQVEPVISELPGNRINITYKVVPGKVVKVGRLTIEGNTKTQDRVIRRELPLKPGENLNTVDLEVGKKRLDNMRYFNKVDISQNDSNLPGYRDINVYVQERQTGSLTFGAGFSSIDSIVGYVRLEQTNFDLFNPWNFTGAGQRFQMNLQMGNVRQDFSVSLVEPWFLGRKLSLGGELYYRNQTFLSELYDEKRVGAAIFLRKPLGKLGSIRGEYRLESIEVDADSTWDVNGNEIGELGYDPDKIALNSDDYLRSAISLNYLYDSRDDNITPRKGHRLDASITYAGGFAGGDVDTWGIDVSGQKHWNLKWDTILNFETAISVVESHGDSDIPPIFERKFLGGARNLRGFDFRDVGGVRTGDGDQETLGGQTSAYFTVEYTFPIYEEIRGAVFYDAGIVNTEAFDFNTSGYNSDFGLGLRMNLPFGPIAIDYALPMEDQNSGADGGRFQFYVNTAF